MPTAINTSIAKNSLLSNKPIVLWIHESSAFYNHDAVVNPDMFPNFQDGQLLRIYCAGINNNAQQQHIPQTQLQQAQQPSLQNSAHKQDPIDLSHQSPQLPQSHVEQIISAEDYKEFINLQFDSVIVKGHAVDKESLAKQQQLQISISKEIADRFNLRSRQEVYVELIEPDSVALDNVELAFKEQYLGRSDMWRIQQNLKGTCVYYEKKLLFAGSIKATVKRLFANEEQTTSGYITENTKFVFRSASSKLFLFIQMSKEMWEFDEDGDLYFEKAVNGFLPQLFSRWNSEGTNHVVSIVLFTRVFYETKIEDPLVIESSDGRFYKDFYKVIADWETSDDWKAVIGILKQEQLNFQPNVLLRSEGDRNLLSGRISTAFEGNVLEAINLALNPFEKHYVDRDLMRTGLSIIVITPGVGKFWVDKKLLRLTNERMTDNGIATDLLSLSPLPLHVTPLLCYMDAPLSNDIEYVTSDFHGHRSGFNKACFSTTNSPENIPIHSSSNQKSVIIDPIYRDSDGAPTQKYYAIPHWLDCSFYHHETGRFIKQDKFKTRCKMYELQMMGVMEHDIQGISIPYLGASNQTDQKDEPPKRTIKQQRSSSSLNEKIRSVEDKHNTYSSNVEDMYLSTSANVPGYSRNLLALRHPDSNSTQSLKNNCNGLENSNDCYKNYDNTVFKTSSEPRFCKKITSGPPNSNSKSTKTVNSSKNSFDVSERPEISNLNEIWQNTNTRHKSNTQWTHTSDQRRISLLTPQSQQTINKGFFEGQSLPNRRDDKAPLDPFKSSPTHNGKDDTVAHLRSFRRGTIHNAEVKHPSIAATLALNTPNQTQNHLGPQTQGYQIHLSVPHNDAEFTMSSSTVEPVPINNKNFSVRQESNRKALNASPRQGITSGSLPSIHKQSGNGDQVRTSFGANNINNRSTASHNMRSNNPKYALINPCNPSDNSNFFTSHLRRWQYALPPVKIDDGPVVHWRSLTTPACLPLTTDYIPLDDELQRYDLYMYTVSASEDTNLYQAGDRNLSEHKKTENLLIEMLSQRLAQGFQLIVDNTGTHRPLKTLLSKGDNNLSFSNSGLFSSSGKDNMSGAASKELEKSLGTLRTGSPSNNIVLNTSHSTALTPGSKIVSGGLSASSTVGKSNQIDNEKPKKKKMIWWLSMGHQVHKLNFDTSGQNVEVRRYVKVTKFDNKKMNYKCLIWPKNMPAYIPKSVSFCYPNTYYQWNYLDHLVAGYQDELTDNLRYWRAGFIVIPRETLPNNITVASALHENLDEEEKRIALFEFWIQSIRKTKWFSPEEREELQKKRKIEAGFSDLDIKLTTMDPSAYVASDNTRALIGSSVPDSKPYANILASINIGQTLTRESKSKDIALALQDSKNGVKIADRIWHFRLYSDVFLGSDLVDWLISQIEDINTREKAIQFGNSLMQRNPPLFQSASKRHAFLDGYYYYNLNEEFVDKKKSTKHSSRRAYAHGDSVINSPMSTGSKDKDIVYHESSNSLRQIPSIQSNSSNGVNHFQMSNSMIIDVDTYKKCDRRETAILHYDSIYNPKNCFHFQLNWLGCTAQLIQDLIQNWSRQAERCGLKLVEGTVDQAYEDSENNNPFQCPVPITLAVPPPPVDDLIAATKMNIPAQFYEICLVRHLDFILDVEADSNFERARSEGIDLEYTYLRGAFKYDQYVHRSGVSFVQIRTEGKGFYWINNRLYTNHTPALIANRRQPAFHLCHPDTLRTDFQKRCEDVEWLTEFWETTRLNFLGTLKHDSTEAWVYENSGTALDLDASASTVPSNIIEDTGETLTLVQSTHSLIQLSKCHSNSSNSGSTIILNEASNVPQLVHRSSPAYTQQSYNSTIVSNSPPKCDFIPQSFTSSINSAGCIPSEIPIPSEPINPLKNI